MDKLKNLSKKELLKALETLSKKYGQDEVVKAADIRISATTANMVEKMQNGQLREEEGAPPRKRARKVKRVFDMSKFYQRHIALHVLYLGHNYYGLAAQVGDSSPHQDDLVTIEDELFKALQKTCLISSRDECKYSRCGRTDKGVSAFGQVLALRVRSKQKRPPMALSSPNNDLNDNTEENSGPTIPLDEEWDYPTILNRVLPDDIMVLGWANVEGKPDFSARFSCGTRTYRYVFTRRQLDVNLMREAAKMLEGTHDFRNFCKMNVKQVRNFVRKIHRAEVVESIPRADEPVSEHKQSPFDLCYVEIEGTAFLWHQIRCIMAVLFLVGRGLESPGIVKDFLDLEKTPAKPVYDLAAPEPLVLYGSEFPELDFRYSSESLHVVTRNLEEKWAEYARRQHVLRLVLDDISQFPVSSVKGATDSERYVQECDYLPGCLNLINKPKKYHPLNTRQKCDTYEERVAKLSDASKAKIKEIHDWDL